jgi:hypothetical protein
MGLISRMVPIVVFLLVFGCASAPRETVELAEIVDRQIAEMQASHEKFVRLYYGKLRDDVDHFMEQKWIPQFLANVVEGTGPSSEQFRNDLDMAYKLATLDWESAVQIDGIQDENVRRAVRGALETLVAQEQATLGMVLLDFSEAAQEQINKQRKLLVQPIDEQEGYVLDQLRAGYADLLRGSTAIKGYLMSVVDLVEQRDVILRKVGALETQRKMMDLAVGLSDGAVRTLDVAEEADEAVTEFLERMKRAKDELESIIDQGGER